MEPAVIVVALLALGLGFVLGRYVFAPKEGPAGANPELEQERGRLQGLLDEKTRQVGDWERRYVQAEHSHAQAAARAVELETDLKNLQQKLAGIEKSYTDTFAKLAHETLEKVTKQSTAQFLDLAKEKLGKEQEAAKGELEKRQQAVENLVKPIAETLEAYRKELNAYEKERQHQFGSLAEQVKHLALSGERLNQETSKLVGALRQSQVRGRWGELQLRRVAELAGMLDYCDFAEQEHTQGRNDDTSGYRPDMIVNLPGGKRIIVDAKATLSAFLEALEAQTDDERALKLQQHARQVRDRIKKLSETAYWKQFDQSPEFVVMFVPGESYFTAALQADPSLLEYSASERVLLASPTTLITMLKAVHFGWQQERIAEDARRISDLGRDIYASVSTFAEHLAKVGVSLDKAAYSYGKAIGSLERNFLPKARRLKELGVGQGDEIEPLEPMKELTRKPNAPELTAGPVADD